MPGACGNYGVAGFVASNFISWLAQFATSKSMTQVRDRNVWKRWKIQLKDCYKMETNSNAFAIPILTAILSNAVRIGIAIA